MFAPVIHTYGAISSVRNALGVYLWLQNPPDRGGLIFMGSVNRDFVFAGRRAGRARRTVHTWNLHIRPGEKNSGRSEGSRLRYCTVDDAHQRVPCTSERARGRPGSHMGSSPLAQVEEFPVFIQAGIVLSSAP